MVLLRCMSDISLIYQAKRHERTLQRMKAYHLTNSAYSDSGGYVALNSSKRGKDGLQFYLMPHIAAYYYCRTLVSALLTVVGAPSHIVPNLQKIRT